ncbi:MAG: TetR/AcrR family transcriptional regulator [Bacteroidota bacterium]
MPRVKQFDQQEALQKAMLLFWRKGYNATSIQDLTEHLGISRGSLYDTFGDKKQLFDRVILHYSQTVLQGLKSFLNTQQNVKGAFRHIFQQVLMEDQISLDFKGCFVANTTTEMLPADNPLLELIQTHQEQIEQLFFELLERGVRSGEIGPNKDLKAIARTIYTMMTGFRVLGKAKADVKHSQAAFETVLAILD